MQPKIQVHHPEYDGKRQQESQKLATVAALRRDWRTAGRLACEIRFPDQGF
jgi:hypothetical protein